VSTGIVETDLGGNDQAWAMAIQSDGKVVVAGTFITSGIAGFGLVRYNADGTLDTSFQGADVSNPQFGLTQPAVHGICIQSDGKIVVAGTILDTDGHKKLCIERFNTDGTPDGSFGGVGEFVDHQDINVIPQAWASVVQLQNGELVVVGTGETLFLTTGGVPDTTIGNNGVLPFYTIAGTGTGNFVSSAVQPDGKFLAAGFVLQGGSNFALQRFNSDGTLDTTFNNPAGSVATDFSPTSPSNSPYSDVGLTCTAQPDGKIVVAGSSAITNGAPADFALVRYNTDGSLDTSFNSTGKVTTDFFGDADYAQHVTLQSDGKLVVAGFATDAGQTVFAVARYNTDGSLDASFNGTGKVTTAFGTNNAQATSVAVQTDGSIIVSGYVSAATDDFVVVKYNSDGSIDTSFGTLGAPQLLADTAVVNGYVNKAHDTAAQTLTGTADPGATVAVYDGATKLGNATVDSSGHFTYALGVLANGPHSLTAAATLAATTSVTSAALSFTVDTGIPAAPTALADAAISRGFVVAAGDTPTQALTGQAEAGAKVSVYNAGSLLGTATADGSGHWAFTLGTLADGSYSLGATASDAAGNTSAASAVLNFKVDTTSTAPDITDVVQSGGLITITGTAEANGIVSLGDNHAKMLATNVQADGSGAWSVTLAGLPKGMHDLTATAPSGLPGNDAFFGSARGKDVFNAVGGGDILQGNGGLNVYRAATGIDDFVFHTNPGRNTITGFDVTADRLEVGKELVPADVTDDSRLSAWALAHASESNGNTTIALDSRDSITLVGVSKASLVVGDFHLL